MPAAHGFTFRVASLPVHLDVTVQRGLYLPVLPTAAEQQRASSDPLRPARRGRRRERPCRDRPRRRVGEHPANRPHDQGLSQARSRRHHGGRRTHRLRPAELAEALQRAVRHAHRTAELGLFRPPRRTNVPRPDASDTASDAAWRRYLDTSLVSLGDYVLPEYSAAIEVEARQYPGYAEVTVTLVNTTPATAQQHADTAHRVTGQPTGSTPTCTRRSSPPRPTPPSSRSTWNRSASPTGTTATVPIFGEATAAEIDLPRIGRVGPGCGPATGPRPRQAASSREIPRLTGKPLDTSFPRLISDPLRRADRPG